MIERGGEREPVLASDAERESTIGTLREHCGQGRLTLEEFAERLDVVLRARTRAELDVVTRDLPVEPLEPVAPAPRRGARSAGDATPQRSTEMRRRFVAILGRSARGRRWRVPEQADALAVLGECELDLREAVFDGNEIELNALAILGDVVVMVPEGMRVEVTGMAILGDTECRANEVEALPGLPVLRLRAYALLGNVVVKARPRPRFGQQR